MWKSFLLLAEATRYAFEFKCGPEEVICTILIAEVDLDILDLIVDHLIMGAVIGIELRAVYRSLRIPMMNLDYGILMELIETDQVNTNAHFSKLTEEGQHFVCPVLRSG